MNKQNSVSIIDGINICSIDISKTNICKKSRTKELRYLFHIITITLIIAVIAYCIHAYNTGIFSSIDAMAEYITQIGLMGVVVFILIQMIQVIIPIMPGGISCVVGVIIFGPLYGFLYNYIGIVLGSVINFLLARHYGRPFIQYLVSERTYEKYAKWLDSGKKFDNFFAMAIFFPIAPDDFLCMLAGLTKMKLKKFLAIIIFGKPASIFIYSLGLATVLTKIVEFITNYSF